METVSGYSLRTLCFGLLLALLLTGLANTAIKIAQSRKRASGLVGIPMIFSPLSTANPLWKALRPWLMPMLKRLRPVLGNWTRHGYNGWTFEDKYRMHSESGDVFTLIGLHGISVILADPQVVQDIVGRRRDFPKPVHRYGSSFLRKNI